MYLIMGKFIRGHFLTMYTNVIVCLNFLFQDAERESIEMQGHIESLKEEKERLLNSLVEAE